MTPIELLQIVRQATIEGSLVWRQVRWELSTPYIEQFGYLSDFEAEIQNLEITLGWYTNDLGIDFLYFEVCNEKYASNDLDTGYLRHKEGLILIDLFLDVRKKWLEENRPNEHYVLYGGDELDAMADEEELLARHLLMLEA